MGKYYYLIAGLPNIAFDDKKLPYSTKEFREDLAAYLTKDDARLIALFDRQIDNKNALRHLQHPGWDFIQGGTFAVDTLDAWTELIAKEREGVIMPKKPLKEIPAYLHTFLKIWQEEAEKPTNNPISWEDRMAALYYDYAMKNSNRFVSEWFSLCLHATNIVVASTCRKYNLDRNKYIVGDTAVCNLLRTSNARDFDLGEGGGDLLGYFIKIGEETNDLIAREKSVDYVKWQWLEEQTAAKTFDEESVIAYMLKLEMLERWTTLNPVSGEETFRSLVGKMKKGSDNALEEFKRNNTK